MLLVLRLATDSGLRGFDADDLMSLALMQVLRKPPLKCLQSGFYLRLTTVRAWSNSVLSKHGFSAIFSSIQSSSE